MKFHDIDDEDFIHPYLLAAQKTQTVLTRRNLLLLGAASVLTACNGNLQTAADSTATVTAGTSDGTCSQIPSETKGPFPLDGSNGTNALSSIYRSNIVGSDITNVSGVPLQVILNIQNVSQSCAPVTNAAVYIWHCDQYGSYSGYSSSQNGNHYGKTFCRGIVVTNSAGQASFTTVYPGWYTGRITHIHMAIYLNNNLSSTPKVSQMAFPQATTYAVYNTSPYTSNGQNTSVTGFSADNIFSDGTSLQMATISGSVSSGLVATLNVGV